MGCSDPSLPIMACRYKDKQVGYMACSILLHEVRAPAKCQGWEETACSCEGNNSHSVHQWGGAEMTCMTHFSDLTLDSDS